MMIVNKNKLELLINNKLYTKEVIMVSKNKLTVLINIE